jgi:hypothetical protein
VDKNRNFQIGQAKVVSTMGDPNNANEDGDVLTPGESWTDSVTSTKVEVLQAVGTGFKVRFTPPNLPPPAPTKAVLTSPTPGSTFTSKQATFTWNPGSGGVVNYQVSAGLKVGGREIVDKKLAASTTSLLVKAIPTGGQTIYVRLWTKFSTGWVYNDYTFVAANLPPMKAVLKTPQNGTTFAGPNATFTWSTGQGAINYQVSIGSFVGGRDIQDTKLPATTFSLAVTSLPTNGSTVYVRMWTKYSNGVWAYNDYVFTAAGP